MSVGTCFHDYSMATFVRDKRCFGHVLTKTVADLLTTCGFQMWYWGYKNGYMKQYDKYGGRSYTRSEFWNQWGKSMHETATVGVLESMDRALIQTLR